MESSILSTQAQTKIISIGCVANGLLMVELPSLNEMKQGNSLLTNIMIGLKGSQFSNMSFTRNPCFHPCANKQTKKKNPKPKINLQ